MGFEIENGVLKRYTEEKGVTDIVIPDSVTSIGDEAFEDCERLKSITIPDSVTSIGRYAFDDCENLTSITIPNSVTSIGNSAFRYCKSLTSITLPDSVTSIGNSAFEGCQSLTSITIPDSITSIHGWTFRGCESLTSITLPNGVTSIGDGAFLGCSSLTSITIPDSVTSIGRYAFGGCEKLIDINFELVCKINRNAFDENLYMKLCIKYGVDDVIKELCSELKSKPKTKKDKERKKEILEYLCYSDKREILLLLEKENMLERAAEVQNVNINLLRNSIMSDFSLESDGTKVYDLGNDKIKVILNNDLTLSLEKSDGKIIKSIPSKNNDKEKVDSAKADFADLKKNIKNVAKQRALQFRKEFARGTFSDVSEWKKIYFENPVLRQIASLLVWKFDDNNNVIYFMPTMNQTLIGSDGNEISLPDSGNVSLASPIEMKNDILESWKAYITDNHIAQPFTQIFENIYNINKSFSKRYKGLRALYFHVKKLENEGDVNYNESANLYGITLGLSITHEDNWGDEWSKRTVTLGEMDIPKDIKPRTVNHVIYIIDMMCLEDAARSNKIEILIQNADGITEKNINKLIDAAIENECTECTAWLLNYREKHFGGYDIWADLEL